MDSEATVLIVVAIIIVLLIALYWEFWDVKRIGELPSIEKVPPEDREQFLINLACIHYDNGVQWRKIFIGTIIVTLLLWYAAGCTHSFRIWLLVGLITFIIFYLISLFHSYHYNRVLCNKARPESIFL